MIEKQFDTSKFIGNPLLFVGGDLSGIQNFLYNITSKRAALSLKGRSAYLSEVTDKVLDDLIKKTGDVAVKETIYCSGGKFYWIVSDAPQVRQAIEVVRNKYETELWDEHHGALAFHIAFVSFKFTRASSPQKVVFDNEVEFEIKELWNRCNAGFAGSKAKPFFGIVNNRYDALFSATQPSLDSQVCAITGIDSEKLVPLDKMYDDEAPIMVLPSVQDQVAKGRQLYVAESKDDGLKDDGFLFPTFEELADKEYLGVLRMDVDGLGARFIRGFDTMENYIAFSKSLDSFFKSDLQKFRRADEDIKRHLNIIYAGGDDIFAVGRWDKAVAFAKIVHDKLDELIASPEMQRLTGSDRITISGGVAIVDAKYPIAKSAQKAGDAEDAAKKYENGSHVKNAFHFLGTTVGWGSEFDFAERYMQDFCQMVKKEGLSTGLLHKFMAFNRMLETGNPAYAWNTIYYISRYQKDKEKSTAVVEFCQRLKHDLFEAGDSQRRFQLVALAARWAELRLRFDENDKVLDNPRS